VKENLDLLAQLCHAGYGEVEVHLHHDQDTEEGLKKKLEKSQERFSQSRIIGKAKSFRTDPLCVYPRELGLK